VEAEAAGVLDRVEVVVKVGIQCQIARMTRWGVVLVIVVLVEIMDRRYQKILFQILEQEYKLIKIKT
jgi:hypothetical protein